MSGATVVINVAGLYVQPSLCDVSVRTIILAHVRQIAAVRQTVHSFLGNS
jgi:hypothetical protein